MRFFRYLFLPIFFLLFTSRLNAQFADLGTGTARNDIWWFNWNNFPLTNGSTKTFSLPGGMSVTIEINNLQDADFYASKMNTWSGSILHLLYDFSDATIKPALFSEMSTTNPSFQLTFTVTRNGQKIPYHIIAADAEASDNHEFTSFETSGGNWETIQFFRNSSQTKNPVEGCGTKVVTLSETYGGFTQTGQNPVLSTYSDGQQPLVIKSSLKRVGVYGGMAVAFGILAPLDYGDLPSSFGSAYHQLNYEISNTCNITNPLPAITTSKSLMLGKVPGDSDQPGSNDDNQLGVDEDAISDFPLYLNSGTYELILPLNNTTGATAYLTAWFDYNRNGLFENFERVKRIIPNNSTSTTVTWNALPVYLPVGTIAGYSFRFRLSLTESSVDIPVGYSSTGEVEDYFVPSDTLCNLTVQAGPDLTACPGIPVQLISSGAVTYSWIRGENISNPAIPNPIATPANSGQYIVLGSNPQACEDRDTILVTLYPNPVLTSYQTESCAEDALVLRVSNETGLSYSWETNPEIPDNSIATPTVTPSVNSVYRVTATSQQGCIATAEVRVQIKPAPSIILPADTTVCPATLLTISNLGNNADSYRWFTVSSNYSETSSSLTINDSNPVEIFLTGTAANGCSTTDSMMIQYFNTTPPLLSNDTTVCANKEIILVSTNANSYDWKNEAGNSIGNSGSLTITPSSSSRYYLTTTDFNNCSVTDSMLVSIRIPGTMTASSSAPLVCENTSIVLEATGGISYRWYTTEDGIISNQARIESIPLKSTLYSVEIVDQVCQTNQTFEIPVEVRNNPVINFTQSNSITCKTPETLVSVAGGSSYFWQGLSLTEPATGNSLRIKPKSSGFLYVTTSDDFGCSSTDSLFVSVDFSDGIGNPSIPNAFSPNNDGRNDCFKILNWPASDQFRLEIYNRFGQLIFSSSQPSTCWDGKFNGQNQPEGTYIYQIRSDGSCGTIYKKGSFLLLR
ncbi:MAG: CshA/CshB family fibrillar adhesin-related protein [Flavihumibacter sp.]|nr:CshA/CshB family fibrillar adhesin-related protein [Flavihumibacter sp.]